jgi:methyl-accepting chemotaxis protein
MKPGGAARVRLLGVMRTTGKSRLFLASAIAVLVGVASALTGCGSSGGKTTTAAASELETWAGGLCTAVGKYKASVAATRATLHVRNLSRPALQVAVQDFSAATRELTHDLDELGPPPLPQSEEAKKILGDLGADLRKQVDNARAVATNASSTGDVKQAASNITDALTAATDEVSHAVSELRKLEPKAEVEQAFDSADSCSSL